MQRSEQVETHKVNDRYEYDGAPPRYAAAGIIVARHQLRQSIRY